MMGRTVRYGIGCLVLSGAGFAGGAAMAAGGHLGGGPPTIAVPTYDESGALLLPERWEEWVVVGTSIGLSYSEGNAAAPRGPDDPPGMFHNVLMPGWAYAEYRETGAFADRTMLALAIYDVETGAPPRERGFYQGPLVALELHVKDAERFEGDWGFYNFALDRDRADLIPRAASCYSCHAEHAEQDDVFTQFYPALRGPAPAHAPVPGPGRSSR